MIRYSTFLNIPSFFLHGFKTPTKRHPYISFIKLKPTIWVLNYEEKRDSYLLPNGNPIKILNFRIHSESSKDLWHYVSIGIDDSEKGNGIVHLDTPAAVFCTCEDFRYTFSYVLYKNRALLFYEEFPEIFKTVPPKKRNPYQIPWACKHVFTISHMIYSKPELFKFDIETVLRFNKKNIPNARPHLQEYIKLEELIRKLER